MTATERALSQMVFMAALQGAIAAGKDPKAAVRIADATLTIFADTYGFVPPHPLNNRETTPPAPYRFNAWWENPDK